MKSEGKKGMPKASEGGKTTEKEVTATYPSRYKSDKTDDKTMKKINETYENRYK